MLHARSASCTQAGLLRELLLPLVLLRELLRGRASNRVRVLMLLLLVLLCPGRWLSLLHLLPLLLILPLDHVLS
jgi:hypothetical protein